MSVVYMKIYLSKINCVKLFFITDFQWVIGGIPLSVKVGHFCKNTLKLFYLGSAEKYIFF